MAWDQPQITDASELLVFAVKYETNGRTVDEFIDLVAQTRNLSKESLEGYSDMMKGSLQNLNQEQIGTWVSKQAYSKIFISVEIRVVCIRVIRVPIIL